MFSKVFSSSTFNFCEIYVFQDFSSSTFYFCKIYVFQGFLIIHFLFFSSKVLSSFNFYFQTKFPFAKCIIAATSCSIMQHEASFTQIFPSWIFLLPKQIDALTNVSLQYFFVTTPKSVVLTMMLCSLVSMIYLANYKFGKCIIATIICGFSVSTSILCRNFS